MPLFQPSNITPSSFAGVSGKTVAVADKVKITWQVNGNEAMTAFKFVIFDMDNKSVYTSEIIPITPFYPTDKKGNPQYYSYAPNGSSDTWNSLGLSDGNEYTLQITQYWGGLTDSEHSVTQFSQSAFITRTAPTLTILADDSTDFITNGISSVSQEFKGNYTQAQNDNIDWVRWKLFQDNLLVDDTGIVNTQVLSYTADNMQSGQSYKIVCTIQTSNGVQITTESEFSVSYELPQIEGQFEFNCIDKASNLLRWSEIQANAGDDIQGVSNDLNYSFQNGSLVLPQGSTVTWETKNDEPLNIPADWSLTWKGTFSFQQNVANKFTHLENIQNASYSGIGISPNGQYLYTVDNLNNGVKLYNLVENEPILNTTRWFYYSTVDINDEYMYILGRQYLDSDAGYQLWSVNLETNESMSLMQTELPITTYKLKTYMNGIATYFIVATYGKVRFYRTFPSWSYVDLLEEIEVAGGCPNDIAISPDLKTIFIATELNLIKLSHGDYGWEQTASYQGRRDSVAFSQNGDYLITDNECYSLLNGEIGSVNADYAIITADNHIIAVSTGFNTNGCFKFYKISENVLIDAGEQEKYSILKRAKYIACNAEQTFLVFATSHDIYYTKTDIQNRPIFKTNNVDVYFSNTINVNYGNTATFDTIINSPLVVSLISQYSASFTIQINKNKIDFLYNNETQTATIDSSTYPQSAITSVVLSGEQTCEYVYIASGTATFPDGFTPSWGNTTQFMTHFDLQTLQAGQLEVAENSMDIYRENVSTGELEKLYSCGESITEIRDFSWITGNKYNYYGYARLDNAYTSENPFNKSVVCRNQPYYLLIATEQDEEQPNAYHVVHYWRFGNNADIGSVGNNNTPNFLNNFTGYRLKQPTARKGKSGTLTALLSNVSNGEYSDTVRQMENLYALSECNNPLFLKDMKGNLYMVTVSNAIIQTINGKSAYQEVKVSIPWEEIGSAKDVSIIQVPTDEGWVDDNAQLAEVRLEVDEETGMLKVIYPDEYNYATTFGIVKPNLYAKTVDGVEQADLKLVDGAVILNDED